MNTYEIIFREPDGRGLVSSGHNRRNLNERTLVRADRYDIIGISGYGAVEFYVGDNSIRTFFEIPQEVRLIEEGDSAQV